MVSQEVEILAADGSVIIEIDGDDSKFESTLDNLGNVAGKAVKGVTAAIAGMSAALVGAAGYAVKVGSEFETSLAKVSTIADTSVKSLDELKGEVINLSNETGESAAALNEALYSAISAGADTAHATDLVAVAVKAAKGGFTDTETAVDGLTSALNAYGMETTDAEGLANKFLVTQNLGKTTFGELASSIGTVAPTANAAGVSVDDLLASVASLTANGIGTSEAMTGMKAALSNIIKPTADAQKMAEKLGIDFSTAALQGKGWAGFLEEIKAKTGGNTDQMASLFGSVEALNTVLTLTSDQGMSLMGETLDEMSSNTTALDDAYGTMTDTFDGAVAKIKTNAQNLGIAVYEDLKEPLTDTAKSAVTAFQGLQNAFAAGGLSGLVEAFGGVFATLLSSIAEAAPQLVELATSLLSSLITGIQDNLPTLMSSASSIIESLVGGIMTLLPEIVTTGVSLLGSLIQGIADTLPALIPQAVEMVIALVQGLISNIPLLVDAAIQLLDGLLQGLLEGLPILIDAIPDVVTGLIDALLEAIPQIIDAGIHLLSALVDGLPDIISALVEALPELIDGILSALLDNIGLIVQAGIDLLTALVEDLPTIIQTIVDALPELISGIVDALMDNLPQLIDAGITLFLSLIDALPEIIRSLSAAAPKIIDGIVTALTSNVDKIIEAGITLFISLVEALPEIITGIVKAVPQIISALVDAFMSLQSKVMDAGKNIVEGIWQGISGAADWLKDKVIGFASGVLDNIKSFFGIKSPSRVMRDQVGKMLATGIAIGVKDKTKDVTGALTSLSNAALKAAKATASSYKDVGSSYIDNLTYAVNAGVDASIAAVEQWVKADTEAYNRQVDAETASMVEAKERQMGKVSKAQKATLQKEIDVIKDNAKAQKKAYEDAGKEVTDAYKAALEDGYDEALQITKDRVTEITNEFNAAHDEIVKQQESMQGKLSGFGSLFEIDDETGDLILSNLDEHIDAIREYDKALSQLQMRTLPEGFMEQVTALGVEEATKFAQSLLALPSDSFGSYMAAWQKQQDLAKGVAEQFYKSQLDTLNKDFAGKLDAALASVPSTLTGIGQDSIQGMIDGMYSKSGALSDAAARIVRQAINAMREEADIRSPAGKTRDLVGAPMAQGVGVGFERTLPDVMAKMRSAVNSEIMDLSTAAAAKANIPSAATLQPQQSTYYHEYVETTPTINVKGDMAALVRYMYPYIETERKRRGDKLIKGGTTV